MTSAEVSKNTSVTWTKNETRLALTGIVAAAGLSILDESVRHRFQDNRSEGWDDVSDFVAAAGHPLTTLAIGGTLWSYGKLNQNDRLAETGLLAFEAVALSQAGTAIGKVAVGRQRPGPEDDAYSFNPFSLDDDNHSWPSAHTASAFALASVISKRTERRSLSIVSYSLAALVGISRMQQDEHWLSDVVTGALVGELSARLVLNFSGEKRLALGFVPTKGAGGMLMTELVW